MFDLLTWGEIFVIVVTIILCSIFLVAVLYVVCHPSYPSNIHHEGDPDPNCEECGGTGTIFQGHPHFECDCPCKMRIIK